MAKTILQNLRACGFSTASFLGVTDRKMRKLVDAGLVCVSPPFRVRSADAVEYGITEAGRAALDAQ